MLTKQNTQLLNQLESLLYSANLEIMATERRGTDLDLEIIDQIPNSTNQAKAKVTSVARIPNVSSDRAEIIV